MATIGSQRAITLGGQTQTGFNNLSVAYRSRDRLKILSIADLQRNDFLPSLPTLMERASSLSNQFAERP